MTSTDTTRKPDWRKDAACRDTDPEVFFPTGTDVGWKKTEAQAKTVCFSCPVRRDCLTFALNEGIRDGIFGGLTEKERYALRRRATKKKRKEKTAPTKITPTVPVAPTTKKPGSLRAIWNLYARPFGDGHVTWHGSDRIYFKNAAYSPRKISFILDRGRNPEGRVTTTCGLSRCVDPAHLEDDVNRTACGTRPGYQKHQREGTEICAPCRQANTDADNRLRRTGTTKQLAA